ncbi:unnamed protein product [Peniophora sp. CBMAI 1063]|nr:unnamed protein product [Peniophora sp. CBMAI 1063]
MKRLAPQSDTSRKVLILEVSQACSSTVIQKAYERDTNMHVLTPTVLSAITTTLSLSDAWTSPIATPTKRVLHDRALFPMNCNRESARSSRSCALSRTASPRAHTNPGTCLSSRQIGPDAFDIVA